MHNIQPVSHRFIIFSNCFLLLTFSHLFLPTHTLVKSEHPPKQNISTAHFHTITPQTNNDVLLNPGKGWILYGTPSNQTASTIANATVGYTRYNWTELEPEEGKYNWSFIDHNLDAWHNVGKQFAFGVMNANSSNPWIPYITPKWVFTDGAASTKSSTFNASRKSTDTQYIPVWNDPIFLRKVQDFVTALAQRYDGNPNIAFIDIRSYGNWGVQSVLPLTNSIPLSAQDLQKHMQIYRNTFKQTQLMTPWSPANTGNYNALYTWAVNHGIGLRSDGLMAHFDSRKLLPAYGKVPALFELYDSYQSLIKKGLWSDSQLIDAVNIGKPSYVGMGMWENDAQKMFAQKSRLIQRLTNMMGYYFVLHSATLPDTISNNQASTISLSWKNQGVAYLLQPASVAIALLDRSNNVVQQQWLSNIHPRNWTPGKTTITNATISFHGMPIGTYKLAIGLFLHSTDSNPTYKIGNQGQTSNGWYVLDSTISVN